jgi:hypothetical protein
MKEKLTLLCSILIITTLSCKAQSEYLKFNPENYKVQTLSCSGKEFRERAYEGITYVKNPIDTLCHHMNIYIP